ncbi:hypothetical protein EVAR_35692_1 [Eumeta japonica]|uniref:Uncharacterized protein n=1 Tax=Eumeta variegata TaxID=151549 RepID=A0A4C1VF69_EUMVA|nr:hypothetical protein EVAR_35692_1 [Eumeta japonica]
MECRDEVTNVILQGDMWRRNHHRLEDHAEGIEPERQVPKVSSLSRHSVRAVPTLPSIRLPSEYIYGPTTAIESIV